MLIRALIVVLSVLNLGVALWWLGRGEPPTPQAAEADTGVATLELLPPGPATADASQGVPSPAAAAMTPVTPPPGAGIAAEPASGHCLSLGPFVDRTRAEAAAARLAGAVTRPRLREVAAAPPADYRVWIAPAASHQDAQATAKRIVEAGFGDYYVISQGEGANAVALGQYRSREGAERRVAALKAAGFPATLMPGAEGAASWWIDVALAASSSADTLTQRSGAPQHQSLDCARLR